MNGYQLMFQIQGTHQRLLFKIIIMTAAHIKIIILIVAFFIIVGISIFQSLRAKKKEEYEEKQTSLDVDIKDDTYWENRFKGLKSDYEDREKYHNSRYEQIKAEYENREQFLREMLDSVKSDYQNLKNEVTSLQEIKSQLDDKLKQANSIISEYEIRVRKLESQFKENYPNSNTPENIQQ